MARPDGRLYGEARAILDRASPLLFSKGGKQGKTTLGWCIQIDYVHAVKRAIATSSLSPLTEIEALSGLMQYVNGTGSDAVVEIDDQIVSERVRAICRDRRE